jgi:hypothetical protein
MDINYSLFVVNNVCKYKRNESTRGICLKFVYESHTEESLIGDNASIHMKSKVKDEDMTQTKTNTTNMNK